MVVPPDKDRPGVSRGPASTAVTGAEMEVERAWDDRTFVVERRESALAGGVFAVARNKGDFPRGG